MPTEFPIAVIDSGLGGLGVARALRQRLPAEDILCFADTARLPYGTRSPDAVSNFVRQILAFLRTKRPKHVLIACNTATALTLPAMRAEFPDLSISGIIEPASRAAVEAAGNKAHPVIAVLATEATIRSKAYESAVARRRNRAILLLKAAPLLVPIVEEGRDAFDPLVRLALRQYLHPLLQRKMDVLILGCTHYPILRPAIEAIVGDAAVVVDATDRCVEDVVRRLGNRGHLRSPGSAGRLDCFVTDDPERFAAKAQRLLGMQIDNPVCVPVDRLAAGLIPVELRRAA